MIYDACQANGSHCVLMMEPSKTCSKIQLSAALRVLRLAVMDIHDTPHSSHCSLPYIPHSTMIDLIQQNVESYETMYNIQLTALSWRGRHDKMISLVTRSDGPVTKPLVSLYSF